MTEIFELYPWEVLSFQTLQQGLINKTYTVTTTQGDYIFQSINQNVFKSPEDIDHNINVLGNYLKTTVPDYLFTHLVATKKNKTLVEWEGNYYRAFKKINGFALDVLDNAHQVNEAAKQFGKFTHLLTNFPLQEVKTTLPDFHNLSLRYQQFESALLNGNRTRIGESKTSIDFLVGHKKYVDQYQNFIHHNEVKQRVTHHDTKISNVLFEKSSSINLQDNAICVIDLDTVMPGYFISDVGDMYRTCLCPVSEEENNLDLIMVDKNKWEAIREGYLSEMASNLSGYEIDHFIFAGQFMIYMQALRFLTDHLNNDLYYGAKKEGQNLARALNQIRLLELYNQLF